MVITKILKIHQEVGSHLLGDDIMQQQTMNNREVLPEQMEIAKMFGIIKMGQTLEDYLIEAVENHGYETGVIWGVQGSGKSNRMLQMGFWIFYHHLKKKLEREPTDEEVWEEVLSHIIFRPRDFVKRLKEVPRGERIPCLLWDDIGCHYPSSKFKTDPKEYEAIDSTWAVIRVKVPIVIVTIPLVNRLAKNIRDNLTFEVFLGRNQNELIRRVFHLPGTRKLESNFFKIILEQPTPFDLFFVPKWVWDRYWEMRLTLTDEALVVLEGEVDMDEVDGYIPVLDAAEMLKASGKKVSPNTIQQSISRKVLRGRTIKGQLCILEEDLMRYMEVEKPIITMDDYEV